jgi:hypothetical protein
MKKTRVLILTALILCGLVASCNFPLIGKSEEEKQEGQEIVMLATSVAQTLSVFEAQLAEQQQATQVPTAVPLPTATPQSAADSLPGQQAGQMQPGQQQPGVNQNAGSTGQSCYSALLSGETIYDNTELDPDEEFTKTWTVLNAGTCTWNSDYKLVFTSGDRMDGNSTIYTSTEVSPNESITFSTNMTAPDSSGTYRADYVLQTDSGQTIAYFYVQIIVNSDSSDDDDDFSVSSVSFSPTSDSYEGDCPYEFNFEADITTNDAGTVEYYFVYSDGSTSDLYELDFDDADTITVSDSWELEEDGTYTVKLYVESPNNQSFGKAKLVLTCEE